MTKKTKTTKDSYEAAYYMMYGAQVSDVKMRTISKQQRAKKHFTREYIIKIQNIPFWCIMGWNYGITYAPIHEFKKQRKKLKKFIQTYKNK